MKILHINTNATGGAANACIRLHKALLKSGIDSNILFLEKTKGIDKSYSFLDFEEKKNGRFLTSIKILINRISNKLPSLFKPAAFFNTPFSLFDITEHPVFIEADVIHLHWAVKFVDYQKVFSVKNKKFVWTMHDMAPFSGGYHYLTDFPIENYKSLILKYENAKIKALKEVNLSVIALSDWLKNISMNSRVFHYFKHNLIPNCIDTAIFNNYERSNAKLKLGLKQNKTVLFVAENINDKRKGFDYLKGAIDYLDKDTVLLVLGKSFENDSNLNIINLGYISDENHIATIYNAADVFVIPSLEDNLPNTVMEAMACGTPSVGFANGGIPEMVQNGLTGIVVKEISAEALAVGIKQVLDNTEAINFEENCRKRAIQLYSEDIIREKILGLYHTKS